MNNKGLDEAYLSIYENYVHEAAEYDQTCLNTGGRISSQPTKSNCEDDKRFYPPSRLRQKPTTPASTPAKPTQQTPPTPAAPTQKPGTVAVKSGKGGSVTAGKQYPAVLGGKPVAVSYDEKGKSTITPVTSTQAQSAQSPSAPAPSPAPERTYQQKLDDLRAAAAKATLTGPSKEAQALMSQKAKSILGPQKLEAGIKAQQEVEKMKNQIGSAETTQSPRPSVQPSSQTPKPPVSTTRVQSEKPQTPKSSTQQTNLQNKIDKAIDQAADALKNPFKRPFAEPKIKDMYGSRSPEEQSLFRQSLGKKPKEVQDLFTFLYQKNEENNIRKNEYNDLMESYMQVCDNGNKISGKTEEYFSYNEVVDYLLSEGYSEDESNEIIITLVNEGGLPNFMKPVLSRIIGKPGSNPIANIVRAGATDLQLANTALNPVSAASDFAKGVARHVTSPPPQVTARASQPRTAPKGANKIIGNVWDEISTAARRIISPAPQKPPVSTTRALPGTPERPALPAAGKSSARQRPIFNRNALPNNPPKPAEPAGALARTKGDKPTVNYRALFGQEPSGSNVSSRTSRTSRGGTRALPPGQEVVRPQGQRVTAEPAGALARTKGDKPTVNYRALFGQEPSGSNASTRTPEPSRPGGRLALPAAREVVRPSGEQRVTAEPAGALVRTGRNRPPANDVVSMLRRYFSGSNASTRTPEPSRPGGRLALPAAREVVRQQGQRVTAEPAGALARTGRNRPPSTDVVSMLRRYFSRSNAAEKTPEPSRPGGRLALPAAREVVRQQGQRVTANITPSRSAAQSANQDKLPAQIEKTAKTPVKSRRPGPLDSLDLGGRQGFSLPFGGAHLGAAVAGLQAYNTGMGTRDTAPKIQTTPGKIGSTYIDYDKEVKQGGTTRPARRLTVGPKMVGQGKVGSYEQNFDKAYKKAKDAGKTSFKFDGKDYSVS